ncbi:unnamed protein product [Effrenium voratum]|nr:unnamed protein product [Effrenium voratum]
MLARALIATYGGRTWRPDPDNGKWRLQVRDNVMLFHAAPILSSAGARLSKLDNGDCMPPLDHFLGRPPPLQDFLDDDEAPETHGAADGADRDGRPQHKAMAWLTEGGDGQDGVMVLPEDIVEELEAASMGHTMLIFESVVGKAVKKIEFATLKDNGDGSTGKGTLRELCEKALGQGSRFAWVDDFAPNQQCCFAADLRREHPDGCAEGPRKNIFSFHGLLLLCTNGVWQADAEFFGSDGRRITGVKFEHNFVDNPTRPHELLKDNSVKQNIPEMFAEFWWVARVFWLAPHPGGSSDNTIPIPASSVSLKQDITERPTTSQEVDSYIADQLGVRPTAVRDELKKRPLCRGMCKERRPCPRVSDELPARQ